MLRYKDIDLFENSSTGPRRIIVTCNYCKKKLLGNLGVNSFGTYTFMMECLKKHKWKIRRNLHTVIHFCSDECMAKWYEKKDIKKEEI